MALADYFTVEDDKDLPPFKASEWIGVKRVYRNVPEEVSRAKNSTLQVPEHYCCQFPQKTLSVTAFLACQLPDMSNGIITTKAALWFSKDVPSTMDPKQLWTRPIPSKKHLHLLDNVFGQMWFDGAKSIVDPRYNDGEERLPLWVLGFWREMARILQDRSKWRQSICWLNDEKKKGSQAQETMKLITEVLTALDVTPWNTELDYSTSIASTLSLTLLLGNDWLDDEHLNMMMEALSKRLEKDELLKNRVIIAPLALANELQNNCDGTYLKKKGAAVLCRYEKHIKENKVDVLCFPVHVNSNHWIAAYIDFTKGRIGYGDSLAHKSTPHREFMLQLRLWLSTRFDMEPEDGIDSMKHGKQNDTFNCGPAAASAITHHVFGDPLWTPETAVLHRLRWFLLLSSRTTLNFQTAPQDVTPNLPDVLVNIHKAQNPEAPAGEMDIHISIALAQKDHNFSDLAAFVTDDSVTEEIAVPLTRHHLSILDLLNPLDKPRQLLTSETVHNSEVDSEMRDNEIKESDVTAKRTRARGDSTHVNNAQYSQSDDCEDADSSGCERQCKRKKGDGSSKSAIASMAKRRAFLKGELIVSAASLANWKERILAQDAYASFDPANIRRVRHSGCGKFFRVKEPLDITRWNTHMLHCQPKSGKKKAAGTPSLFSMPGWGTKSSKVVATPMATPKSTHSIHLHDISSEKRPCPGITELDCPEVSRYLMRSSASGGGGRSIATIAKKMFSKVFSNLQPTLKDEVLAAQAHTHSWKNDHKHLRVYSVNCTKSVPSRTPKRPLPCDACISVMESKAFKVTLGKKTPLIKNQIYTNKRYQNPILGNIYGRHIGLKNIIEAGVNAKTTPCIRYAEGVLEENSKYDDKIFSGLLEAFVQKVDRTDRGVGMQNLKYSPAWDETCHIVNIASPRAYRALREHLPMPAERTFRIKEARQPRFPFEICDRTYQLVEDYLKQIDYSGPTSLSCDDTKLFSTFRLYWDASKKSHYLIGGTEGPIPVVDPENMKDILAVSSKVKATKLRLWCLTIAAPKVTPIIVAAMAIASNLGADILYPISCRLIRGLILRGVRVISYACDGTEIERAVQRLLIKHADSTIQHTVKSPRTGNSDLIVTVPIFHGQAVAMVQDSKHALKTFRNNLFSGARLLVLGNHIAVYIRIHGLAFEEGSPLYNRDVEKLDRQDDSAATRLFSAATLKFLCENHPDYLGEIVFLFVFGELIDAYQNRSIMHIERIKLVLRARYFLDAWEAFLNICNYPKATYTLSREALDITRIIIEGFLSLIFIHRESAIANGDMTPLYPWLHSSEACEHTFAESRNIVKDFTMLDFLYMVPKLRLKMRQAILKAKTSDGKSRASGYTHTYFDMAGLDQMSLAMFPSDLEIEMAAIEAADECDSLISLLGLIPVQVSNFASAQPTTVTLPAIGSWYHIPEDSEPDSKSVASIYGESISEAQQIQDLLDDDQHLSHSRTKSQEAAISTLTCAAIAVTTDEITKVHEFAALDVTEDPELEELVVQEYEAIQSNKKTLKALALPDNLSRPLGKAIVSYQDLDFESLISMRRAHQTRQAETGIRTKYSQMLDAATKPETLRRKLIRRFHEVLKEEQVTIADGTGSERKARWMSAKGGQFKEPDVDRVTTEASEVAGNSSNAIAAATVVAQKASSTRTRLFNTHKVPHTDALSGARVTIHRPLVLNDWVIAIVNDNVVVGQVIIMYSKTAGKNSKHEPASTTTNISALSKIVIQVFENTRLNHFTSIPAATALLQVHQHVILPPLNILTLLQFKQSVKGHRGVELAPNDMLLFRDIQNGITQINKALKAAKKRTEVF